MIRIDNKILNTDVVTILKTIRTETAWKGNLYLKDIKPINNSVLVTCPFHKNHSEKKPACGVFTSDTDSFKEGEYHCFACGATGNIIDLTSACFEETKEFAKEWLLERFGNIFVESSYQLPYLSYNNTVTTSEYLDESILNNYVGYHPYMWKRKLTKEVVDKFNVGYDKDTKSITFPIFDEHHKLVMITKRSVEGKHFFIEENKNKPVYLLYDILQRNIKSVIVCESQINTLTLRSWGYDSVGLIGTGSAYQYEILKKSGINNYFLALDGDNAGRHGIQRFITNMSDSAIVNIICIPEGKDVNDLSKEEFMNLKILNMYEWKNLYK